MLKDRTYPILIICYDTDNANEEGYSRIWDYASAMKWKNKIVIYMGDEWRGKDD